MNRSSETKFASASERNGFEKFAQTIPRTQYVASSPPLSQTHSGESLVSCLR